MSLKTGLVAEEQARAYLITQGLQWVESNYRCRWGEIDLIMCEKKQLIFVEVKARSSRIFGGALASVTYSKQKKLLKTAEHYLVAHNIQEKYSVRFDVLGLEGIELKIEWIKNAFGLNF